MGKKSKKRSKDSTSEHSTRPVGGVTVNISNKSSKTKGGINNERKFNAEEKNSFSTTKNTADDNQSSIKNLPEPETIALEVEEKLDLEAISETLTLKQDNAPSPSNDIKQINDKTSVDTYKINEGVSCNKQDTDQLTNEEQPSTSVGTKYKNTGKHQYERGTTQNRGRNNQCANSSYKSEKQSPYDNSFNKHDRPGKTENKSSVPRGRLQDSNRQHFKQNPINPTKNEAVLENWDDWENTSSENEKSIYNPGNAIGNSTYDVPEDLWNNNNSSPPQGNFDRHTSKKSPAKSASVDLDFETFDKLLRRGHEDINYDKTEEIPGDLFTAPKEFSLAHCVAEDLSMGSGIAVKFRQEFFSVGDLLNQRQKQGGCAFLEHENRYVYYLVTKKLSIGKPTMDTLWKSLIKMKILMQEHNVSKLAIPRIGCGLDRLDWKKVRQMLEYIFQDMEIDIKVYNIQMDSSEEFMKETPQKKVRSTRVCHEAYPLTEMDSNGAILIYLATEDGRHFPEAVDLFKKFPNLSQEFRVAKKELANVIRTENKFHNCIIYGLVVKKTLKDKFDFKSFESCIKIVQKSNRKDMFSFIGLEAFKDASDDSIMMKIINILMNSLSQVSIYICWPKDLHHLMPTIP